MNTGEVNTVVQQYAAVNRITFGKIERIQARYLKKTLQQPTKTYSSSSPLTTRELDTFIRVMKIKGVSGPGNTPLTSVKVLGLMVKVELLSTVNESFSKGGVPEI